MLELIICRFLCRFFFTAILCGMSHSDKNKINDDFKLFFIFFKKFMEAQLKINKF